MLLLFIKNQNNFLSFKERVYPFFFYGLNPKTLIEAIKTMEKNRGKFVLNERITADRLKRFLYYIGKDKIKTNGVKIEGIDFLESLSQQLDEKLNQGLVTNHYLIRKNQSVFNLPVNETNIKYYELLLVADNALVRLYRLYALGRFSLKEQRLVRHEIAMILDRAQHTLMAEG